MGGGYRHTAHWFTTRVFGQGGLQLAGFATKRFSWGPGQFLMVTWLGFPFGQGKGLMHRFSRNIGDRVIREGIKKGD